MPPAPTHSPPEIESVLLSAARIQRRVRGLAAEIQRDFKGEELLLVPLLNGTILFLADLIRHLQLPMRLDFLGVSSYGRRTQPGQLIFTKQLQCSVRNQTVLVIDDILDTGQTLHRVLARLRRLRPRSLHTCVLLSKSARRSFSIKPDYVGFEIPDVFVVGYGLDYAEHHRNLPYIGVLKTPPRAP